MMQPLCTVDEQCLHFFPDMGFRPAVHVVQRDQYGDRLTLVVGDDSPLEGKVPPRYDFYELPVDVYGPLGGAPGPVVSAALSQGAPNGGGWRVLTPPFFGGSGGSSPGRDRPGDSPARPGIDDTSSTPPDDGTPSVTPVTPQQPTDPTIPSTETPVEPELPPLQPVPLPDAAPLLIASLLAFALLRRTAR